MAKNDNQNDMGDYLAQVEKNNRKIQSHTGLPWYKGSKLKYKKTFTRNSILVSVLLGIGIVFMVYVSYKANPNFLILWVIFLSVFGLMFYDASKKPKR